MKNCLAVSESMDPEGNPARHSPRLYFAPMKDPVPERESSILLTLVVVEHVTSGSRIRHRCPLGLVVVLLGLAACGRIGFESVANEAIDAGQESPATCSDGEKGGSETDVDCGGECAAKCESGAGCAVNGDCLDAICSADVCVEAPPDRYATDFDSVEDWTISGDALWECGDQTDDAFGPPSGISGNSVCGTRLNANYELAFATANLTSPSLSLSEMQRPQLSFWMDMEAEVNSCGGDFVCDGGHIELSVNGGVFVPLSFADTGRKGLLPNAFAIGTGGPAGWHESQPLGEWAEVQLDLFELDTPGLDTLSASDTLRLRFVFRTDSAEGDLPGWYIDDFRLFERLSREAYSTPYLETFEAVSDWQESGGGDVWSIGPQSDTAFGPDGAVSGTGVAGTGLNATYELSPTSTRYTQAFLTSPSVALAGSSAPQLSFWMDMESNGSSDGGHVGLSINDGPFVALAFGDPALTGLPYSDDGTLRALDWPADSGWSGLVPSGDWAQVRIDLFALTTPGLDSILASDTIRVRFGFLAGRNDSTLPGWYIDDVAIGE